MSAGDEQSIDRSRILISNPVSGSGDHAETISRRAAEHGFTVRHTAHEGDAMRLAREAADSSSEALIAAAGGDGTVNEVVNGIVAADALESTTLAVVPSGTGNNFASNIGLEGLEHAFSVIEDGRRRRIDLGVANDRVFVNSCVGGVTAQASEKTSSESKARLGVLAYVKETLDTLGSFDGLPLRVRTDETDEGTAAWAGTAMFVLVGNCRRFGGRRTAQANVEDGQFEVTIIEDASMSELLGNVALEELLGRPQSSIVRYQTPFLTLESRHGALEYSLDGELLEAETLSLETRPNALTVAVGDSYQPTPDGSVWPLQ